MFKNRSARQVLWVFLFLVVVASFLHIKTDLVPDVDSFYHIRHAEIYKSNSLLDSSFPWAQYSVINQESADIWYGFHVLLIPFTFFSNLLSGITFAGVTLTVISLLLVFLALKRLGVAWPAFWIFIFLFSAPDILYRFGMLRPHILSLGLTALIFSYFVSQQNGKRIFLPVFLSSALFLWSHIALAWLPILIVGVVSLVGVLQRRKFQWKKLGVFLVGLIVGVLVRPNPIGAIKLAWVQTGVLLTENLGSLPIRFGRELTPFVSVNFFDQLLPITILLVMGILLFAWLLKRGRGFGVETTTGLVSSLALSLGFLYLTFGVARRAAELFVIFSILFLALLFTYYKDKPQKGAWFGVATLIVLFALVYMPIKTFYRYTKFWGSAFPARQFEGVGDWLKENSRPEEIVFSPHWDRFAQLFFWNTHNYYINGMDPIFIYALSPELYWKTHFLATDEGGAFTCAMSVCSAEEAESTYNVLKEDFEARYIVVEPMRSPNLYSYLSGDSRFSVVFTSSEALVYKIK